MEKTTNVDDKATVDVAEDRRETAGYERPEIKSMSQGEVLSAVKKGSKFPARGFSG